MRCPEKHYSLLISPFSLPSPPLPSPQSHAGKVVMRNWYERNKHIFPASRWEPYDPEKKWDKYTVSIASSCRMLVTARCM